MKGFEGLYTAIITPFRDGKIDFPALEKILEHQIAGGVDGVVPAGTTGESPTLSHQEHSELIRETIRIVNGRVKVIAGTGSNSTREAIRLSEEAAKDGADGLLQVNPYYNKPGQEGLFRHFSEVARVSSQDVPVMLYNIPGRTAVGMTQDTIRRLSEVENIVSIKEATGNISHMAEVVEICRPEFTLLSGDDNMMLPVMAIGGRGVVSVISNLFPKEVKKILDLCDQGDFTAARQENFRLLPLCRAMFMETNPIPVKKAMEIKGFCSGEIRLPMTELTAENTEKLKKALEVFAAG